MAAEQKVERRAGVAAAVQMAALSVCGGICGSYGVILCGRVFGNAQTGNLLSLAAELCGKNWGGAAARLGALALFVLGTAATVRVPQRCFGGDQRRWRQCCLAVETGLFLAQGLLPQRLLELSPALFLWPVFLISGLQYNTFNRLAGVPVSTLFSTNNLRQAVLHAIQWRDSGSPAERRAAAAYLLMVLSFLAGAVAGVLLVPLLGMRTIFVCAAITAGCFLAGALQGRS